MGVYIKGMQMPKGCNECCFCSGYMTGQARILGYVCLASLGKEDSVRGRRKIDELCFPYRPNWCPLVELPNKHGRLIDADKLFEELRYANWEISYFFDGTFLNISEFANIIQNIVTVIEAEGTDEGSN